MKTLKEALFSRKNITKIKNIQEVIKYGGCILIHDYNKEIIIYNTYNSEEIKIFRSVIYNTWDIINDYNDKFDVKEYISNECDLYTIEGYNERQWNSQWPKLRRIFFDILGEPISFKSLEYIIESIDKYNMELQQIAY